MADAPRTPLTDSPWFWLLLFSLFAILALGVIGPKYGRRQANIEQKFQAREQRMRAGSASADPDNTEFASHLSQPGNTLIPLWPLLAILMAVALGSGVVLVRQRKTQLFASDRS